MHGQQNVKIHEIKFSFILIILITLIILNGFLRALSIGKAIQCWRQITEYRTLGEWNSGRKSDKFLNHYHPHPLLSLQGMALEYIRMLAVRVTSLMNITVCVHADCLGYEALQSHSLDARHSLGLLWMSDQSYAETSTSQHTIIAR